MTPHPVSLSSASIDPAQVKRGANPMKYLAKSNVDFREASRREDSRKLQIAFEGPSQAAVSERASRALGVSPRQIVYWLKCENDMPSWAVKAVEHYLSRVERLAERIEGRK